MDYSIEEVSERLSAFSTGKDIDLVPAAFLDATVGSRVLGESDEILMICLFLHGYLSRWEASQKVDWKSKEIKT